MAVCFTDLFLVPQASNFHLLLRLLTQLISLFSTLSRRQLASYAFQNPSLYLVLRPRQRKRHSSESSSGCVFPPVFLTSQCSGTTLDRLEVETTRKARIFFLAQIAACRRSCYHRLGSLAASITLLCSVHLLAAVHDVNSAEISR